MVTVFGEAVQFLLLGFQFVCCLIPPKWDENARCLLLSFWAHRCVRQVVTKIDLFNKSKYNALRFINLSKLSFLKGKGNIKWGFMTTTRNVVMVICPCSAPTRQTNVLPAPLPVILDQKYCAPVAIKGMLWTPLGFQLLVTREFPFLCALSSFAWINHHVLLIFGHIKTVACPYVYYGTLGKVTIVSFIILISTLLGWKNFY